jgi:hypothetical protein
VECECYYGWIDGSERLWGNGANKFIMQNGKQGENKSVADANAASMAEAGSSSS